MSRFFAAMLLATLSMPMAASAAIDETIRLKESIEINAPADKVWAKVGNFGDMSWHPEIAKTEVTSGKADQVDATRALTFKDGGGVKLSAVIGLSGDVECDLKCFHGNGEGVRV